MKHDYISCDCCGKVISNNVLTNYYKIKHGLRFGTWGPDDIDIRQNCWDDIQEYVKEKRNDRICKERA